MKSLGVLGGPLNVAATMTIQAREIERYDTRGVLAIGRDQGGIRVRADLPVMGADIPLLGAPSLG